MIEILNFAKPEIGGIASIIYWLITISASVGLGVILFTLVLKVITLPFDYISRASMRKNNIIMENMRPELEKLQKQYADNKDLYSQKMMALYKKNGFSIFSSCLPTIITLVILIVAISSFTTYSQYQNCEYFYNMSNSYNRVVYEGLQDDDEYIIRNEDGTLTIDMNKLKDQTEVTIENSHTIYVNKIEEQSKYEITTTDGYVKYVTFLSNGEFGSVQYHLIEENLNNVIKMGNDFNNGLLNVNGKTFNQAKEIDSTLTAMDFLNDVRSVMSAKQFRSEDKSFLWVKNIWIGDAFWKNPIPTTYDEFLEITKYKENSTSNFDEEDYTKLIKNLEEEKGQQNGYAILILLTIATSLLTQWVSTRSQKASNELQTVDGQGAMTSKMMMWMMPLMMAVFAFLYSAAFSIYIILNSVFSLLTTLIINFIVDKRFKNLKTQPQKEVIRGRVYNKPQEEVKKPEKKKKQETPKNDFLSGLADKKKKKK